MDRTRFENDVKLCVYQRTVEHCHPPTSHEVARELRVSVAEVEQAFVALHAKRLLVPEPGDLSRIRMAPPFSGIETGFETLVESRRYHANCAWDALGVAAALHHDAEIEARDGHTGEPIHLAVRGGRPLPEPCVIHFAVPAARWWDDIIHT